MGTGGVRSPRNGTQPNGVPKNTSPKTQLCRKGCPHVAGSLFLYFRIGLRFPSGRIRDRETGASRPAPCRRTVPVPKSGDYWAGTASMTINSSPSRISISISPSMR